MNVITSTTDHFVPFTDRFWMPFRQKGSKIGGKRAFPANDSGRLRGIELCIAGRDLGTGTDDNQKVQGFEGYDVSMSTSQPRSCRFWRVMSATWGLVLSWTKPDGALPRQLNWIWPCGRAYQVRSLTSQSPVRKQGSQSRAVQSKMVCSTKVLVIWRVNSAAFNPISK